MNLKNQISFRNNINNYNYLQLNSWYYKELNRGNKNYSDFEKDMKNKYKQRTTDKISNAIDNIDVITSMLDMIK